MLSSGTTIEARHLLAGWDAEQLRVITADSDARLIVEAGPGTGKTAVACVRLAHLIAEDDIEPSNILMISFTRAAAAEIRRRLHSYVGEASYAIHNATIDSHAWAIRSGHDPNARLTRTYDDNIERVIALLKSDENVADEYAKIEHVVIDEAQDIVGSRAELIETLICQLPSDCGVTIFADEAQTIYGFSKRNSKRSTHLHDGSLLERVRNKACGQFTGLPLKEVHRTSSPRLKTIYSDLRTELMKSEHRVMELRDWVANAIEKLSTGDFEKFFKDYPADAPQDLLILFRNRAEVLEFSQAQSDAHSLRLSEYDAGLPAWLALCFSRFWDPFVSEGKFRELWSSKVVASDGAREEWRSAWISLLKLAGRKDGTVDMLQLRRRLAGPRPPLELARSEFGLDGFTLSTIHASKGREADVVILMMPEARKSRSVEDVVEEARVLFVGATRARKELYVAPSKSRWRERLDSGRVFYSERRHRELQASVEIGRNGDIEPRGLVGTAEFTTADALAAQDFLAAAANSVTAYHLQILPDNMTKYGIISNEAGTCVGTMSANFANDIREISAGYGGITYELPNRIDNVRAQGCSSIVLAPEDSILGTLNEPWASSGFVLTPKIAAFPFYRTDRS
ncbi:UvrD-helicase domain-containing protein [Microvirga yunnanensis]|uniref:UvrD-helicase domain-containing protein n=1 Tax=Microvirga yunnanensis TaxID=2953740 RepID=UPI0021C74343|nr:UvrD-helicase domain-containing protein [Microvirga sp. HBU65207]